MSQLIFPAAGAISTGPAIDLGDPILNSCRFEDLDRSHLTRTPPSAGDQKLFTISLWAKVTRVGKNQYLCGAGINGVNNYMGIVVQAGTNLLVFDQTGAGADWQLQTAALQRDPAGWFHVVLAMDTDNATESERAKLWINGQRVTDFVTEDYPFQGFKSWWNHPHEHRIGDHATVGSGNTLDGYEANVISVEGQALEASDFGRFSADTGEWVNKNYSGTFGTEGFRLNFADSADLGNDVSGNDNDFTSANLTTEDQVIDTPTNNFPTFNKLITGNTTASQTVTYVEGNLRVNLANTIGTANNYSTMLASSGKWHFEVQPIALADRISLGICQQFKVNRDPSGDHFGGGIIQYVAGSGVDGLVYDNKSSVKTNTAGAASGGQTFKCEVDLDDGRIEWFDDTDTSLGFYDFTPDGGLYAFGASLNDNTSQARVNFGQQPFKMTPSEGFRALSTASYPALAILNGREQFSPLLWAGDDTSPRDVTGLLLDSNMSWVKNRTGVADHYLGDTVRGQNLNVSPSTDNLEFAATAANGGGVDLPIDGGNRVIGGVVNRLNVNENGNNYVGWNWQAGVTPGLAIIAYTGDGNSGRAVPHGLGVAPEYVAVKLRDAQSHWHCYHIGLDASAPENYRIRWSQNVARALDPGSWNNTKPDATNVYLGNSSAVNTDARPYLMYAWAPVPGFSWFGNYYGNGNIDGPFVECGFRPAMFHIKEITNTNDWVTKDRQRDPFNPSAAELEFNTLAEGNGNFVDLVSNGYKGRATSQKYNRAGGLYLFSAWAEAPAPYARAV